MVVYKITNTVNNKVYIGQTVQKNATMRWYSHQADARAGKKSYLYDSIRKHGVDAFTWEIIDTANSIDELNEKEQYWLDQYRSITEVYNNREAGGNQLHANHSILKMKSSQRAAHARRRAANNGVEKHTNPRRDGGAMKGKVHPRKGTKGLWSMPAEGADKIRQSKLEATYCRGRTWKLVDGKRVWMDKV